MPMDVDSEEAAQWADLMRRNSALEASIDRLFVCGNHIATYRSARWPAYPLDGLTRGQQCEHALRTLGAGQEYDMWCCWSGMMQERDALTPLKRKELESEMQVGETVTFWRDCPDCKGRGTLIISAMVPDASMVFHPNNLRQCPRCIEEAERQKPKCNCEAGHDRPYWDCPTHGNVAVNG